MKRILIAALAFLTVVTKAVADEGMWLLPYLSQKNLSDMQAKGLKLSAEDIFSINQSSLKDAIVHFGGGCTGEIISNEGLILTNHHCGYGSIQSHSTVEHNYLRDGFWAMNKKEEIPTPGLSVTFIDRIEDVTDRILPQLNGTMTESERSGKVRELIQQIIKDLGELPAGTQASVREFSGGNQYLLFINKRYDDVRLVGAPPSSIGKFGGDTDNWVWPRHTGDFSLFRVYTDKNGNPAAYSPENIPMKPKKHLSISLKGVREGDFAMIMGFPGTTKRYMTSWEINELTGQDNPILIFVRGERQRILMEAMQSDTKINIQYASKYSGSSNYWKNAIGKNKSLAQLKVWDQKRALEQRFTEWIKADASRMETYGQALSLMENAVRGRMPYSRTINFTNETLFRGSEIFSVAGTFSMAEKNLMENNLEQLKTAAAKFYKDYSEPTDRKVSKRMFRIFADSVPAQNRPAIFNESLARFGNNTDAFVDWLFDTSVFSSEEKVSGLLADPSVEIVMNDPAVMLVQALREKITELNQERNRYQEMFAKGHRLFIAGLQQMNPNMKYYPDANSTIRLTYGSVLPYWPRDAVFYNFYTTLTGVMEKEDPANPYEFTVPERLKELYRNRDFGPYAYEGKMPVCFITNNDITGGNSGSPVMNANGELIGCAFDGNWEGMSGDIAFNPELQRCISVDIRYVLFIIDKYAGAGHLVREMTLVR